jgi:hypothetical protein
MAAARFEDTQTTVYEIEFTAAALGMDALMSGFQFGLGICINDNDLEEGEVKGWSGWAPYSIVHNGKSGENNGLATLVDQDAGGRR